MFAASIDDPRYGIKFMDHHLTGREGIPAIRQWIMSAIKLIRAQRPADWERRDDVATLRAWLDALADRPGEGRRAASVSPLEAVAATFARSVRTMTDEELLYCRLAYQGETGRRGEVLRECVDVEMLRRPWLAEMPEDTSEWDPALI